MFKKLCVLVLAVGTSYAMEDITNTPTGDENIKQAVEEVKQTIDNTQTADDNKDKVNEVADDFSILNIDKTVEQLNRAKYKKDKTKEEDKVQNDKVTNGNVFFYNSKGERIVNLNKLIMRPFDTMTDDEKDWAKLYAYNMFSKTCQMFIKKIIWNKSVSKKERISFYKTDEIRCCVLTGLDPRQIFLDELKFNVNPNCCSNKKWMVEQFGLLSTNIVHFAQKWRAKFLENGLINK